MWPKASYVVFHFVTCLNTGSGLMYLKTQIWAICFCVRKTTLIVLFGNSRGWSTLLGFECFLDSTSDFFECSQKWVIVLRTWVLWGAHLCSLATCNPDVLCWSMHFPGRFFLSLVQGLPWHDSLTLHSCYKRISGQPFSANSSDAPDLY